MDQTEADDILSSLKKAGFTPLIKEGRLVVRGPQNALPNALRQKITENKVAIMEQVFDEIAVGMMRTMFTRVNAACPPESGLAYSNDILLSQEERIDAAYRKKDLGQLKIACANYEQIVQKLFNDWRVKNQVANAR